MFLTLTFKNLCISIHLFVIEEVVEVGAVNPCCWTNFNVICIYLDMVESWSNNIYFFLNIKKVEKEKVTKLILSSVGERSHTGIANQKAIYRGVTLIDFNLKLSISKFLSSW